MPRRLPGSIRFHRSLGYLFFLFADKHYIVVNFNARMWGTISGTLLIRTNFLSRRAHLK